MWDDAGAKWWFSVLDMVGAINGEDEYSKTRNYWKHLKTKLKREGNELVSATNQLKLTDKIADHAIFMKGIDYSYYYGRRLTRAKP